MSGTCTRPRRLLAVAVAAATAGGAAFGLAPAASAAPAPATVADAAATVTGAAFGVADAPAAPPATAATTAAATNDQLVQSWYVDFLAREDPSADPARALWVDRLDRGDKRGDVLWSITESREYAELSVEATYALLLGRDLDPGAEYWVSGVDERGMAVEWVQQQVLVSDEFFRVQSSGSTKVLVSNWYKSVLGRTATAGELSYWTGRVAAVGRLAALREIWYTPEAVQLRVVINYEYLLLREPSAGELRYWAPKEVESDRNVAVLIASTPEYAELVSED